MAAHAVHHPRSGRFVKGYLITWGLLATCALGYLGSLAWQPEFLAIPPPRTQTAEAEPDPILRTANKALAEITTVQRSVGEIQRDVRQLKATVEQQETQGRGVHARLAAIEERVTAADMPVTASAPAGNANAAERVARAKSNVRTVESRPMARVVTTVETQRAAGGSEPAPAAAPIETGSIQGSIVFGDPVVTAAPAPPPPAMVVGAGVPPAAAPAQPTVVTTATMLPPMPAAPPSRFAVQLAAGPSLDALKLQWSMLAERHGAALAALQPHFVPPQRVGGPYRLVAGPLPSKAEADSICKEMGVGRNGCFSTILAGEPL